MPIYTYINDDTGETKDIYQGMNDLHEYFEGKKKWRRVFAVPQAATDQKIDPFSREDFMKKTNKPGQLSDLWDRSKEWSERRRAQTGGPDAVKNEYLKKERAKGKKGAERARIIEKNDTDPVKSRKKKI